VLAVKKNLRRYVLKKKSALFAKNDKRAF